MSLLMLSEERSGCCVRNDGRCGDRVKACWNQEAKCPGAWSRVAAAKGGQGERFKTYSEGRRGKTH